MGLHVLPLPGEAKTLMFDVMQGSEPELVSRIKNAVLAVVDNEDGDIEVLVNHGNKFEWLPIDQCIPVDSPLDYTGPKITSISSRKLGSADSKPSPAGA
jgi:hypothetical protein